MIISVLSLTFMEGKAAEGVAAIRKALINTRGFAGCLGVDVTQDTKDPHRITVIERWDTIEHDTAYRAWAASQSAESPLRGLISAPPSLSIGTHLEGV